MSHKKSPGESSSSFSSLRRRKVPRIEYSKWVFQIGFLMEYTLNYWCIIIFFMKMCASLTRLFGTKDTSRLDDGENLVVNLNPTMKRFHKRDVHSTSIIVRQVYSHQAFCNVSGSDHIHYLGNAPVPRPPIKILKIKYLHVAVVGKVLETIIKPW
jgi:hypothetical protein